MLTLELDTASLLLLGATVILALYLRLGFSRSLPLVHPLLLAKQSEVSATRLKNQSGVYRNWGTGHGVPVATKPSGGIGLVSDLVDSNPDGMDSVRGRQMYHGILEVFGDIVGPKAGAQGGSSEPAILAHIPTPSTSESAASDNNKAIVELAALHLCTSLSKSLRLLLLDSPSQVDRILTSEHHDTPKLYFCRMPLLETLLNQLIAHSSSTKAAPVPRFGIIVADVPLLHQSSETSYPTLQKLGSKHSITVSSYWDVLVAGSDRLAALVQADRFGDLSAEEVKKRKERGAEYARLLGETVLEKKRGGAKGEDGFLDGESRKEVGDVHAITNGEDGQAFSVTNENITSGLASLLSLFPASHRPTPSLPSPASQGIFRSLMPGGGPTPTPVTQKKFDDVYLVDEELASPVGMTLLLLGVLTSQSEVQKTQLTYLSSEQSADVSGWLPSVTGKWATAKSPTLAFIHKARLEQIVSAATTASRSSPFYGPARRSKLVDLQQGYLSRVGWVWSKLVWGRAHNGVGLGGVARSLRGIVVIGEPPSASLVREAQIHLSLPISRAYTSPQSCGPILGSHFHDFQHFDSRHDAAIHVGPPTTNMEVMLKGEGVEQVETGGDPEGRLWARGPGLVERVGHVDRSNDGWQDLNRLAMVKANGTFDVL